MSDTPIPLDRIVHDLGNYLSVVAGFTELTLQTLPADDPRHADLIEVRDAANAAIELVHTLAKQIK